MAGTQTPAGKTPSGSRKAGSISSSATSGRQQQSILGFFAKASPVPTSSPTPSCLKETTKSNRKPSNTTPVPSSDALEPSSSQENHGSAATLKVTGHGSSLFSRAAAKSLTEQLNSFAHPAPSSSPTLKVKPPHIQRPLLLTLAN